MKYLIALLLATTVFTLEVSQNEIDNVEELLAQLKGSTQAEIDSQKEEFEASRDAKQETIVALTEAFNNQKNQCTSRDQDVKDRQSDIEKTQNYIDWVQKRQVSNNARVELLRNNSCAQNEVYIVSLKNMKISLRLVIFLRNALQNSNDADFSLAQQKEMGKYVLRFLAIYKHAKHEELVELTNQIEQTFKVKLQDVSLEQTKQVTISGTKAELIEILNNIEADIRRYIQNSQDQQVRVGIKFADFLNQIAIENVTLEKIEGDEERNLESLQNQLVVAQNFFATCQDRLRQLQNTLQGTQQDLQSLNDQYTSSSARLQSELALFDDVYRIYSTQVATSDDRFKSRVDEYSVKKFGSSSVQISMEDAIKEEAQRELQMI